jgi:RNA polymerase sigma-70 factor (ECF subfamily)
VHPDAATDLGLDALFQSQRVPLLRLAHLLTGSFVLAEEIVQEAFIVLQVHDRAIDNPAAYARGIVVNLARKTQRRRALEHRHAARRPSPPVVLPPDLDETWAAIRRLSPDQRAVVVLRFYEDATLDDIAAALDKPLGTVKSHLHRALRRLAKELQP